MGQGTNRTISEEIVILAHVAAPHRGPHHPAFNEHPTARNQFSHIESLPPRGLPQSTEVSAWMADSWRSGVSADKQEVGDARGGLELIER